MARAVRAQTNGSAGWDNALATYREQLRFYLDYLLECKCDQQILADVEAEVLVQTVPDEFKQRFLVRTLVRRVIEHLRDCTRERENVERPVRMARNTSSTMSPQERLVYFMRDVLEYSTRDASLLIGITDSNVEKLLSVARKEST